MLTVNFAIPKIMQGLVMILAVIAVAVADVLLKKAAAQESLRDALKSPWLLGAVLLYFIQIGVFTAAFIADWKLSIIGGSCLALQAPWD